MQALRELFIGVALVAVSAASAQEGGRQPATAMPTDYNRMLTHAGTDNPHSGFTGISVRIKNDTDFDAVVIDASGNDFDVDRHHYASISRQPATLYLHVTFTKDGQHVRKLMTYTWYDEKLFSHRADEIEACVSMSEEALVNVPFSECGE